MKRVAIQLIESLPDDCTLEDIQYHLFVWHKALQGLRDIEDGAVVASNEAAERIRSWFASSGPNRPSEI